MNHSVQMRVIRSGPARKQAGFSLFELIVYMLISSILFATAFNRYQAYPAEAERANFMAVLNQLKTGVNLKMITSLATGTGSERAALEGINPMQLMLQTPGNYLGSFSQVDESQLPRRTWYFDEANGELVYLANRADNLFALTPQGRVASSRIRLHVVAIYDNPESELRRWQGVALVAAEPYEWLSVPLELPEAEPEQPEVPELDPRLMELVDSQLQ